MIKPKKVFVFGVILCAVGGIIYYVVWARIAHATQQAVESGVLNGLGS